MPSSKPQHWLDDVSDQLVQNMDDNVDWLSEAFLDGARAPGAADLTEAQKLDYYKRHMFNPDGTPNEDERSKLLNKVGIKNYTQIYEAVTKKGGPFTLGEHAIDSEPGVYDNGQEEQPTTGPS